MDSPLASNSQVELILAHRLHREKINYVEYKVKWKKGKDSENSWLHENDVNADDAIKDYWKKSNFGSRQNAFNAKDDALIERSTSLNIKKNDENVIILLSSDEEEEEEEVVVVDRKKKVSEEDNFFHHIVNPFSRIKDEYPKRDNFALTSPVIAGPKLEKLSNKLFLPKKRTTTAIKKDPSNSHIPTAQKLKTSAAKKETKSKPILAPTPTSSIATQLQETLHSPNNRPLLSNPPTPNPSIPVIQQQPGTSTSTSRYSDPAYIITKNRFNNNLKQKEKVYQPKSTLQLSQSIAPSQPNVIPPKQTVTTSLHQSIAPLQPKPNGRPKEEKITTEKLEQSRNDYSFLSSDNDDGRFPKRIKATLIKNVRNQAFIKKPTTPSAAAATTTTSVGTSAATTRAPIPTAVPKKTKVTNVSKTPTTTTTPLVKPPMAAPSLLKATTITTATTKGKIKKGVAKKETSPIVIDLISSDEEEGEDVLMRSFTAPVIQDKPINKMDSIAVNKESPLTNPFLQDDDDDDKVEVEEDGFIHKSLFRCCITDWEERVKQVMAVEKNQSNLRCKVEWDDGKYCVYPMKIIKQRCPQKLLDYYESLLHID